MRILFIIMVVFTSSNQYLLSQVGINTANPNGMALYVEGGNTLTNVDDVVVDANGNVGVGIIPSAKLSVKGLLNYPHNNPRLNTVLVSDEDGFAGWTHLALGKNTATWELANTSGIAFEADTPGFLSGGISRISGTDEIGVTLLPGGTGIRVPAGRYLMMIKFDVGGREYGIFQVHRQDDITNSIFMMFYGEMLNGATVYIVLPTAATLMPSFTPIAPDIVDSSGQFFYLQPPYTKAINFTLNLLLLN